MTQKSETMSRPDVPSAPFPPRDHAEMYSLLCNDGMRPRYAAEWVSGIAAWVREAFMAGRASYLDGLSPEIDFTRWLTPESPSPESSYPDNTK